jgi:transposase
MKKACVLLDNNSFKLLSSLLNFVLLEFINKLGRNFDSQYTYIEACWSQKREDLISCMTHDLSYYGGVPKAIVSNNLKSAVTRVSKYEPDITRSFKDLARHYICAINPTSGYSTQDIALLESAVYLAYQRIFNPSAR